MTEDQLQIELADAKRDIPRCRNAALRIAEEMGFGRHDQWSIVSAVHEACANAVTHGSADSKRPARVILSNRKDRFEAIISDSGTGSKRDLASVSMPPPTAARGRGIPLMKDLMDEVGFHFSNGCSVTLIKYKHNSKQE